MPFKVGMLTGVATGSSLRFFLDHGKSVSLEKYEGLSLGLESRYLNGMVYPDSDMYLLVQLSVCTLSILRLRECGCLSVYVCVHL